MKLIKCHIENFGRLSDADFDFTDGLNTLNRGNGWGKSTMSEFLCAMFYGLPDKSIRKHYQPWQGGNYGGYAEFELSDGKSYRVERYFRKSATKSNPDEFRLIDLQTGVESDRFSDNLGYELFEINASGYMRSAFINKRKLYDDADEKLSDSDGAGSVSARLGGLLEAADDIGSYEGAIAALDKKRRYFVADRGNGGQICIIETKIAETERDIASAKSLLESAKQGEVGIARLDSGIEELENSRRELEALQKQAGLRELARQYEIDRQTLEKEQGNADGQLKFFKGKLPGQAETDEISKLIAGLKRETEKCEEAMISDADAERMNRLSCKKLPDIPDDELREIILKLEVADRNLRETVAPTDKTERLKELEKEFSKGIPDAGTVEIMRQSYESYKNSLTYMTFAKEKLENEKKNAEVIEEQNRQLNKKSNSKNKKLTVLSECIAGFGIAMTVIGFMISLNTFWIPGLVLTVLGFVGSFIFYSRKTENPALPNTSLAACESVYREKINQCLECKQKLDALLSAYGFTVPDSDYRSKISEIGKKVSEIDGINASIREFEAKQEQYLGECDDCRDVLLPIFGELENRQFRAAFENTVKERNELEALKDRLDGAKIKARELADKIENYRQKLNGFFANWYLIEENPDYEGLLKDLTQRIGELQTTDERVRIYADRCRTTLESNPEIAGMSADNNSLSTDDSESRLSEVRQKLAVMNDERIKLVNQVNEMYNGAANLPELENRYDGLRERHEAFVRQHKAIENAIRYLGEAKNNLSVSYLRQMNRSFAEYMSRLCDSTGASFRVDRDFNVKFDEAGKEREAKSLSDGWRDLVGFCTRLSLVKALFPNEKPFLVIDDPFANLDRQHLDTGKQMLSELASEYQIIYFTCADERA